jgi:hypothetical protein
MMLRFLKLEWKYFVTLAIVVVALGLGFYEFHQWRQTQQTPPSQPQPSITINTAGEKGKPQDPQVVYIQGQNKEVREIVYVPKEIDPQTGEKERTDVEFKKQAGKVYVKVNGKEYEVPAEVQEEAKFENGKLVVTEKTEMRINITAPKPAFNLGLGASNNGMAIQANGPIYKSVSWWAYGDRRTVAGGIQIPIMK